jgi:hypothetical protein
MRVLPADVYDTLELSALVFDGIGRLRLRNGDRGDRPCCIHGHAYASEHQYGWGMEGEMSSSLFSAQVSTYVNDDAVAAINKRKHLPFDTRVSFPDWCAELDIVRGA